MKNIKDIIHDSVAEKLKKIGKEFFINHYSELQNNIRIDDNEYTPNTLNTKNSVGKSIFREHQNILALEICRNSIGLNEEIRVLASNLLESELDNENTRVTININENINTDNFRIDELLLLYNNVLSSLKNKQIVRSGRITGDIGERIAIEMYKTYDGKELKLQTDSNPAFDAININNGEKYQIKTISKSNKETGKITNILTLDDLKFDYFVIVYTRDYINYEIYELTKEQFFDNKKLKKSDENSYCIKLNEHIKNIARKLW